MNVRKLVETDYDEILTGWWKDWKWTPPEREMLPENGTGGFIIFDEDIPVCAGFLYNTNSNIAWVEFVVSNFNYKDRKKRKWAFTLLLSYLENLSTSIGKKYLYSILKSDSLIKTYEQLGYVKGDNKYQEMIKITWQQQQQQ